MPIRETIELAAKQALSGNSRVTRLTEHAVRAFPTPSEKPKSPDVEPPGQQPSAMNEARFAVLV